MLASPQAGGMYSILSAEAPASAGIWWAFTALHLLDEAAGVLADAEVESAALAEESTWRNDGLSPRKLRATLDELHMTIMHELAAVRHARARVERAI